MEHEKGQQISESQRKELEDILDQQGITFDMLLEELRRSRGNNKKLIDEIIEDRTEHVGREIADKIRGKFYGNKFSVLQKKISKPGEPLKTSDFSIEDVRRIYVLQCKAASEGNYDYKPLYVSNENSEWHKQHESALDVDNREIYEEKALLWKFEEKRKKIDRDKDYILITKEGKRLHVENDDKNGFYFYPGELFESKEEFIRYAGKLGVFDSGRYFDQMRRSY